MGNRSRQLSHRGYAISVRKLHLCLLKSPFGNRLGVAEIALLTTRVGTHVLRRHQPRIMAKQSQLAAEMMRADTGLHADQAGWHVGKTRFHLATRPLLPQRNCPAPIQPDDVERVLADIDADHGDHAVKLLSHGVLLSVGVPASLLADRAQEHSQTMPLADIGQGLTPSPIGPHWLTD